VVKKLGPIKSFWLFKRCALPCVSLILLKAQQQRMLQQQQQQQGYPETPSASGQMYPGGQQGNYPGSYGQSSGHQRFPYQQYPQQVRDF
jgi:hypothetical protein